MYFGGKAEEAIQEDLRPVEMGREIFGTPIRKVDIRSMKPKDGGQMTK